MKKRNQFFIIFLVFLFFALNFSYGETLNEDVKIQVLTPNINYIEKTQLTNEKWIIIKSLIIDISDENTNITTLFNDKNLKVPKTLTSLCKETNNLIGAINGDFFNSNEHTAIGPIIDNGNLLYNGTYDSRFNTFGLTNINTPFIANLKKFNPIIKTKNMNIEIDYKNKDYSDLNNIVLLDEHFDRFSFGNTKKNTTTEIVIKDNLIIDIRYNLAPIEIPENGFIIVIPDTKNLNISTLKINDKISIINPKITDMIKTAIGGGSILVKDSEISSNFSLEISGEHPRTAIGFTSDKNHIIMTTIEGRKQFVPGVTENELAQIMIDLGADYALNLDGGGSSTLLVREFGINELTTMNFLSDGSERRIYNGIGIVSNYEKGTLNNIKATLNSTHSIINNPITIDVLATDKYFNPIDISYDKIKFDSTIKGDFINNEFYPLEVGKGYIIINYDNITIRKEIFIHDEISEIKLNSYHFSLKKDESASLNPILISEDGYEIPVSLNMLELTLNNELINIENNKITLLDDIENYVVTINYKNTSTDFDINMNNFDTVIVDDFEILKGNHEVYPIDLNGNFNLFNSSLDRTHSGRLFYDFTKYPTKTRASYYVYENPVLINKNAKKIGLDVFGYLGKNHWLRVKVSDNTGTFYNLTLSRNIDWDNWKYIEVEIPDNIVKPIKIEKIYLVETDFSNSNSGVILFDNLQIKIPKENLLNSTTNYKNIFDETMDLNYTQDNLYISNEENIKIDSEKFKLLTNSEMLLEKYPLNSLNTNKPYEYIKDENKLILTLNNSNQTLLNNHGNQWLFLKKYILSDDSANLIIFLTDEFEFSNILEKELFFSYLKKHKQKNDSNIFIVSTNDKFLLTYDKSYPIINLDKNEYYVLKFNFFKNFAKFKLDTLIN